MWTNLGTWQSHEIERYNFRITLLCQSRTEDIELAQRNDRLVGEAWVGHPYYELIDNSTDFQVKMRRLCRFAHD